ncbi:MAG: hypothetical protein ACPF9K_13915 [Neptuniibacter sp.]
MSGFDGVAGPDYAINKNGWKDLPIESMTDSFKLFFCSEIQRFSPNVFQDY